ncbi:hypothetical protein PSAC2689_210050 [Paraburkholderia sacchari]
MAVSPIHHRCDGHAAGTGDTVGGHGESVRKKARQAWINLLFYRNRPHASSRAFPAISRYSKRAASSKGASGTFDRAKDPTDVM